MEVVDLSLLTQAETGLSAAWCSSHAECAALCLERHDHQPGVAMPVEATESTTFTITFVLPSEMAVGSWEIEQATEFGAYAIGLLVVKRVLGITKFQRSYRGGNRGFDFYGGEGATLLFQKTTRIELSGILRGDAADVARRVVEKLRQIGAADAALPAYAVVVEFSRPTTAVKAK